MCFNNNMKVDKLAGIGFKNGQESSVRQRREIIDVLTDSVMNPRDVNDCVAVPRGIFKAYMLIMTGSAILALSNLIKGQKKFGKVAKTSMVVFGWCLNALSALYFAKPFAFKGLSPTVKREDLKAQANS